MEVHNTHDKMLRILDDYIYTISRIFDVMTGVNDIQLPLKK